MLKPKCWNLLSINTLLSSIFMSITNLPLSGVEVNQLNTVVVSIHPVKDALRNVQTQTVRPQHCLAGQKHLVMRTIHPSFLDLPSVALCGVLLPVSPVHPSGRQEEASPQQKGLRNEIFLWKLELGKCNFEIWCSLMEKNKGGSIKKKSLENSPAPTQTPT